MGSCPSITLSTVMRMIWGESISISAFSAAEMMLITKKALEPLRKFQISLNEPSFL